MTTVAMTGAAGSVGRVAAEAFEADSLERFTHEPEPGDGRALDVTDSEAFVDALRDADVLVHLAWEATDEDEWAGGHARNVRGVYNAYEAARRNELDRVVFASSSHVVGMYNRDDPTEMESLAADASTAVAPEDPPRPDSYYGVAKVACEAMGSYYADRRGLDVVNLRIGWLLSREELRETQRDRRNRARFARAMWLSHGDCRSLVRAAALEPIERTPLTLNAVSRNAERVLTLTETALHLGYRPEDDATRELA